MAVVPAERVQDATNEIEMDDIAISDTKERVMYINTDNCFLRRTLSAPSCELRDSDTESNFDILNSSAENAMVTETVNINCKVIDIMPLPLPSRTRTYSADSNTSQMTLNVDCNSTSASPVSVGSPARRIMQIRREESVDELTREVAKERDVTSAINLSRSLDETSWLGEKNYMSTFDGRDKLHICDGRDKLHICDGRDKLHICDGRDKLPAFDARDKPDSIDVLLTPYTPSIPSPVRHPSIPSPVRFIDKLQHNRSLTPSPICVPISPKQRTYRRSSISPSNLRPSLLTSKRKLDPDDRDSHSCSPAKRNSLFYSPTSTLSSISSNSSPDRMSDTSSNQFSCDDDSGSDHGFTPTSVVPIMNSSSVVPGTMNSAVTPTVTPINNLLSCDTRTSQSFAFTKLQYVAPQSPLAAGGLNHENKRKLLGHTSYTFTPVKE